MSFFLMDIPDVMGVNSVQLQWASALHPITFHRAATAASDGVSFVINKDLQLDICPEESDSHPKTLQWTVVADREEYPNFSCAGPIGSCKGATDTEAKGMCLVRTTQDGFIYEIVVNRPDSDAILFHTCKFSLQKALTYIIYYLDFSLKGENAYGKPEDDLQFVEIGNTTISESKVTEMEERKATPSIDEEEAIKGGEDDTGHDSPGGIGESSSNTSDVDGGEKRKEDGEPALAEDDGSGSSAAEITESRLQDESTPDSSPSQDVTPTTTSTGDLTSTLGFTSNTTSTGTLTSTSGVTSNTTSTENVTSTSGTLTSTSGVTSTSTSTGTLSSIAGFKIGLLEFWFFTVWRNP